MGALLSGGLLSAICIGGLLCGVLSAICIGALLSAICIGALLSGVLSLCHLYWSICWMPGVLSLPFVLEHLLDAVK